MLLSSIYRRHFNEDGTIKENCHLDYPGAMEELALRENVIYIDMCELTKQMLMRLGDEKSKELFMNFKANIYENYPNGKEDNTHLRPKGANRVCEILVEQIGNNLRHFDSELDKLKLLAYPKDVVTKEGTLVIGAQSHIVRYYLLEIAACAAASLAIGTLKGEQET